MSECVVTVPYYLTEHERRIIIDAAAMVDLSVIMLVNDNTAVAIRWLAFLAVFMIPYFSSFSMTSHSCSGGKMY